MNSVCEHIKGFSPWIAWRDRSALEDIAFPGVYSIALSPQDISGKRFSWIYNIVYIGMTNSKLGLKARLQQFDNTLSGKTNNHGGAQRVKHKHPTYDKLTKKLYVSVCPTRCNVSSQKPKDLRLMGSVAAKEYDCLAAYAHRHKELPEFNDVKRSPKK